MYILGINMSHDRSACLLKDGRILCAIAEERLDRDKRSCGILVSSNQKVPPFRAITYCLSAANISIDALKLIVVDHAVVSPDLEFMRNSIPIKNKNKIIKLPNPSHHLAHAYSSYFCSPFKESAVLIADVFGSDLISGNEGETGLYAKNNSLEVVFKTLQPKELNNSKYFCLTFIYRFVTMALGFFSPLKGAPEYGWFDEAGKTMALAAFGRPVKSWPRIVEFVGDNIRTNKFFDWVFEIGIAKFENNILVPKIKPAGVKLNQFHKNLAYKIQEEFELGLLFHAKKLSRLTKSKNLCLAGGAALNCVANAKILNNPNFKNIFIQPAASDDGNAIGAAMYGWHAVLNQRKRFCMKNAYLGKEYPQKEAAAILEEAGFANRPLENKELLKQAAFFISQGKVVGWFQGGSEFGPRALGHRSILADPRRRNMKYLINKKVKKRESFRPYAPSVLAEYLHEYFDITCLSPFMLLTGELKKEKRGVIPAAEHIDHSARIQTVTKKDNGIFYELIKEFYNLTGIPVVLNTSFNLKGKPIVETPLDALRVFMASEMDVLVLGNYLLNKEGKEEKITFKNLRKRRRIMRLVFNS